VETLYQRQPVTVGLIVGQMGTGLSLEELLTDCPYIERQDIMQALRYAAWRAEEREANLPEHSILTGYEPFAAFGLHIVRGWIGVFAFNNEVKAYAI